MSELTKEEFEAGIRDDRTVEGHPVETYYCPLEYATQGGGYLCFIGDNDATNVEIRVPFSLMEQNGWVRKENSTHTFTDAELARLIEVATREQRYAASLMLVNRADKGGGYAGFVTNAPAPSFEHVMKKYEELKDL